MYSWIYFPEHTWHWCIADIRQTPTPAGKELILKGMAQSSQLSYGSACIKLFMVSFIRNEVNIMNMLKNE